jgi:DNA processing protein
MAAPISAEVRDLLALHLVPGLGPRRTAALLRHFGSATAARCARSDQLLHLPGFGDMLAHELPPAMAAADVDAELALIEKAGVQLLSLGTTPYPASLATIPDPPHLLYLRGTLTDADARAVALVGSRRCTTYGRRMTERLASGLARAGVPTVSGLARGIDGIAHKATLDAGGRTLAVLAGGLSRIYPPEHTDLARAVEASGALLTESRMGQSPEAGLFPARNRIISGLSQVIVIVEAPEKSGALITAEHAAEQGRTVMAVPGPADVETSAGCHALLRQGAILCRSADDILEELHGVSAMAIAAKETAASAPASAPTGPPPGLDDTQRCIWDFLGSGPRSVDEMAQQFALPVQQLTTTLLMLEMKKVVRRLPGNRYERS